MRKPSGQTVFLGAAIAGAVLLIASLAVFHHRADGQRGGRRSLTLRDIPFDGSRSYEYLKKVCALGPRMSGSRGMAQQQDMLADHFSKLGGLVELQSFDAPHPVDDSQVRMANLIVQWHPAKSERVLLCAHYDTRPYPDEDPDRRQRRGVFVGANDGASGVAVLCELAHHAPGLRGRYGVDFVLFDGEEFIIDGRGRYFLGSEHFARRYKEAPPGHTYRWGLLLDMVGDAELHLYQEVNSMRWRDTRPLTKAIWDIAGRLGVSDFIPRTRHQMRDDHVPLHDIAGIPACVLIDFDYPRPGRLSYWHTTADTPDKCSALSLAKVGWVVHEWLRTVE